MFECEMLWCDPARGLREPILTSTLLLILLLTEISSFSVRQELLFARSKEAAGYICLTGSSVHMMVLQRLPGEEHGA